MPYGRHIYSKSSDIENSTMSTYQQFNNALPHWKFVLRCCADFSCINTSDQEIDKKTKKQHPKLGFTFITSFDVVLLMVELH